jgi:hypothetical protein
MDSQMEDTPANYNSANQRFEGIDQGNTDNTLEEEDEDDYGMHHAAATGSDMENSMVQDG